ncbi:dUTP diphosphatase [Candidatus Pacearchaeota archaeon]|nr:dUTP diphosphatase [Candidatus Pacearchaeota archaeon]
MVKIKIKKINPDAIIPRYAHEGDAGMDLCSVEEYELKPMESRIIKTGLQVEIPEKYFGSIRDRSGLAAKNYIHTLAGVVDSHYRGEVGVVLINLGKEEFKIKKYDRIAQMLIQPVERVGIVKVENLSETIRGEGGFGSTGVQ